MAVRTDFITQECVTYKLLHDGVIKETEYDDKVEIESRRLGRFSGTKLIEKTVKVPKIVEYPKYKHDEEALAKMHLDAQMHFKRIFTERGFVRHSFLYSSRDYHVDSEYYQYPLVDTLNRWYERNHITKENIISVQIESFGIWVTWND